MTDSFTKNRQFIIYSYICITTLLVLRSFSFS